MTRRAFLRLSAAGLAVLVTMGCGTAFSQASPQRIVAVGGSVTEIVFALGEQERLIARDTTSTFPEEANSLPDVGYIRRLSPEGVMSVAPDMVLMLEGSGPPETVDLLAKSGMQIKTVPEAYTAEGILEKVRVVGTALGVEEKATALAEKLNSDLAEAKAMANARETPVRVLFVLSTQGGRIMASGSRTAAAGMLSLAGAQNATPDFNGYKQLTDEAIMQAAPDVILMMSDGRDHANGAEAVFDNPAIAATPAGINRNLIRMPGSYLLGFGPRTAEAVRELSAKLSAARD